MPNIENRRPDSEINRKILAISFMIELFLIYLHIAYLNNSVKHFPKVDKYATVITLFY